MMIQCQRCSVFWNNENDCEKRTICRICLLKEKGNIMKKSIFTIQCIDCKCIWESDVLAMGTPYCGDCWAKKQPSKEELPRMTARLIELFEAGALPGLEAQWEFAVQLEYQNIINPKPKSENIWVCGCGKYRNDYTGMTIIPCNSQECFACKEYAPAK